MRHVTPARRKAIIIALLGLLWVAMGLVVGTGDSPIDPDRAIIYEGLPLWLRVATWIVTGLVAILALPVRELRRWSTPALTIMVVEKIVGYAAATLALLIPGYPPGYAAASSSLGAWLIIGGIIYLIAGMPEDNVAPGVL